MSILVVYTQSMPIFKEKMEDDTFKRLLDYFDYSWEGYRKVRKGVKKRISRHMQEQHGSDMNAYIRLLERDASIRRECQWLMTVPISRFFRDRQVWEALGKKVLPELAAKTGGPVRVWSAGCSGGEEVYSFRIVWERMCGSVGKDPQLRIVASDANPEVIQREKKGTGGLLTGGWIIVGAHENLPQDATGFVRAASEPHFYRKIRHLCKQVSGIPCYF